MSGLTEPSVETLQYTGETVRKVMETLQSGEETVPQSIVLAVSGLASGSVSLTRIPNYFKSHLSDFADGSRSLTRNGAKQRLTLKL